MPDNFEEANAATQELFNNPEAMAELEAETAAEAEQAENEAQEKETQQSETDATLETAVGAAEAAAQAAAERDEQLKQAMQQIEALRGENAQLRAEVEEISEKNAEAIVEEALAPPTLDISGLAFVSDEEQQAAMAKFAEDMAAYNRQQLMKELSPTLDFAKRGMYEAEKADTLAVLSKIPELAGIADIVPNLDRIIEKNKWLQAEDMPLDEKYINAFAIAKGVNAINNPVVPQEKTEPTTDELMEIYENNPEFRELIEKKRLEAVKGSQQVPPFSASTGAAGAALDIKEKPQTIEEASERTRKLFGLS